MTRLQVNLSQLADVVDRMAAVTTQLTATRDDVDVRVRDLHVSWTGEAANTHAQAQRDWDVAAEQVQRSLAALRAIAATAHANYDSAVVANRRMWSS